MWTTTRQRAARWAAIWAICMSAIGMACIVVAGCGSSPDLGVASPDLGAASPDGRDGDVNRARETILRHMDQEDLSPAEVREWIDFAEQVKKSVKQDMTIADRLRRALKSPWVAFGFLAQATFMMRFVLQIIASERKKKSYVPVAFWYLSLVGGLMLFTYALQRRDPVFVFGQGLGIFIYARNLILIYRRKDDLRNKLAEREQRNNAADESAESL